MKRWIILATLVVVLSGVATIAVQHLPGESAPDPTYPSASDVGPQPKAVVEGDLIYKFDTKTQEETFDRTWLIKNEGEGDLVLHLQSTTCMCTVAEFPKMAESDSISVKPGSETPLHLTFKTEKSDGRYQKAATVGTNDPKRPTITFGTEGSVHPAIIVQPPEKALFFSSIANDVESTSKVALFSPDRPEMKITKVTSSKPDLVVAELLPLTSLDRIALKCKGGWKLNVHVKPGLPLGMFHEVIILKTDHPKQGEVKIDVAGRVTGVIAAMPDRLDLPTISGRTGGKGKVILTVRGLRKTKFNVQKAPAKLKVEVALTDLATGRYTLTVTIPPGTTPGQIEDLIILETDHPQAPTIKIPVNIFVNGPSS